MPQRARVVQPPSGHSAIGRPESCPASQWTKQCVQIDIIASDQCWFSQWCVSSGIFYTDRQQPVSGAQITDLEFVTKLPKLAELSLDDCQIRDLTPLSTLPSLVRAPAFYPLTILSWGATQE